MKNFAIEVGKEYRYTSGGGLSVDKVLEIRHGDPIGILTEEVVNHLGDRRAIPSNHKWWSKEVFLSRHEPVDDSSFAELKELHQRIQRLEAENARWISRIKQLEDKLTTIRQLIR